MPNSPAKPEATNAEADKDEAKKAQSDNKNESKSEAKSESKSEAKSENKNEAKNEEQREGDEGRFTSLDTFANPSEKALYSMKTTTDGQGIERIVAPLAGTFVPAPLEATDEQKAAAERREAMFDKASKERQAALTSEIKDEDRAPNNQAVGGSQTSPIS